MVKHKESIVRVYEFAECTVRETRFLIVFHHPERVLREWFCFLVLLYERNRINQREV